MLKNKGRHTLVECRQVAQCARNIMMNGMMYGQDLCGNRESKANKQDCCAQIGPRGETCLLEHCLSPDVDIGIHRGFEIENGKYRVISRILLSMADARRLANDAGAEPDSSTTFGKNKLV